MASDKEDNSNSWKATALAVAVGAFLASTLFRKEKPDTVHPQRQRFPAGTVFKLFVEAITVLLLFVTAKIQYDSFLVQQDGHSLALSLEISDLPPVVRKSMDLIRSN